MRTVAVDGSATKRGGTLDFVGVTAGKERFPKSSVSSCAFNAFDICLARLVMTLRVPAVIFYYYETHFDVVMVMFCVILGVMSF